MKKLLIALGFIALAVGSSFALTAFQGEPTAHACDGRCK